MLRLWYRAIHAVVNFPIFVYKISLVDGTQPAITWSKLEIETLEQGVNFTHI